MGKVWTEKDISWAFLYDSATSSLDVTASSSGASISGTKFAFFFLALKVFLLEFTPL